MSILESIRKENAEMPLSDWQKKWLRQWNSHISQLYTFANCLPAKDCEIVRQSILQMQDMAIANHKTIAR